MKKHQVRLAGRDLAESWQNLEISLSIVKGILEREDCPAPLERWKETALLTDAMELDLISGDAFYALTGICEGLERLIEDLPE
jgi:hypothetical protein